MKNFLSNKIAIAVFSLPALIIYSIFIIYPLMPELRISLFEHDGFALKEFVGFANYIDIFTDDFFWSSLINSFKVIGVTALIGLPISLSLALILDTIGGGYKRFIKIASFLPAMISVSVISQVFLALLNPRWGLISTISAALGFDQIDLLGDINTVMPTVALVFNWQYIGFNMILFYAGIRSIPRSFYEAALLDGANAAQSAILITIPLLKEIIKYVLIIAIMGGFSFYGHSVVMTKGGPGVASKTLLYYLNDTAFKYFEFGKGSAIAILFVIICVLVTLTINKIISSERVEY